MQPHADGQLGAAQACHRVVLTQLQRFCGEGAELVRVCLSIAQEADRQIQADAPMSSSVFAPLLGGLDGRCPLFVGHGTPHAVDDCVAMHHLARSGELLNP